MNNKSSNRAEDGIFPEHGKSIECVIHPSKYIFDYHFTENECEEKRTGTCPIDTTSVEGWRCLHIFEGLKENKIRTIPQLVVHSCGHYGFSDGRHRICIAQKTGMEIRVCILGESSYPCSLCCDEMDDSFDEVIIPVDSGKKGMVPSVNKKND